jgi:heme/copper-type cytochrome/quinol oxidase subunit 1
LYKLNFFVTDIFLPTNLNFFILNNFNFKFDYNNNFFKYQTYNTKQLVIPHSFFLLTNNFIFFLPVPSIFLSVSVSEFFLSYIDLIVLKVQHYQEMFILSSYIIYTTALLTNLSNLYQVYAFFLIDIFFFLHDLKILFWLFWISNLNSVLKFETPVFFHFYKSILLSNKDTFNFYFSNLFLYEHIAFINFYESYPLKALFYFRPSNFFDNLNFNLNFLSFNSIIAPNTLWLNVRYLKQYFILHNNNNSFFNDWRNLKFERETWRSFDDLFLAKKHWNLRKRYYSTFFEPISVINKVSSWTANFLIPGWAFITPYSSRLRFTAIGKVDIALIVVLLASINSVFSSANYVITYRCLGAPIFKNRRELRSFFVDALLVASRMMLAANPALIIGIILLLSDRHLGTSVFDFSGGGDTILFQHLFWFFGHPEVYIVIIPCFGIINSLLPHLLRKRLSGRLSLQFSMYTIAFMGFAVWGHHMYMVGLANNVRTLYSTMTVMISVPASTKILHWCVTLINSSLSCDISLLFLLAFMYFFVLGGLSGMFVAHIGFDVIFHDTFFVIGHFHVMFAGAAMCCVFAAFYFYFSAIFGVKYSRFFAFLHFIFYIFGQLLTLTPMFWLGYAGMPRRIMDYPSVFSGWHSIISSGHLLTFLSIIFFLFMLLDSFIENKVPKIKFMGVNRINNRFLLYTYELRKIQSAKYKNLNNFKKQNYLNFNLKKLELLNYQYFFKL